MIGVISTGNIQSIRQALNKLNIHFFEIKKKEQINKAKAIIFPGVGSFGSTIKELEQKGLKSALISSLENKPYLGICLGLQILFEKSEEDKDVKGLGIIKGDVKKFKIGKVPHIGWNILKSDELEEGYYYFVHSYYVQPKNPSIIIGRTDYNIMFPSAIKKGNITAVQFHPERSGEQGLNLIKRWYECLPKE